ncbi:hypothetical protein H0X09_03520 [Candidatus Saccharibacteria bacterium]|nr:hypothetical protein [Candidatus Saccharibacteria bacterium]
MNKKSGEIQPQFELPQDPQGSETLKERAMEAPRDGEGVSGKQQGGTSNPYAVAPAVPPAISIPVKLGGKDSSTTAGIATSDLSAQDTDLIEKQWVERAKAIVARTQNDPFIQKNEINKAGADYIKKRFNKTIPTDDTVRK